MKNKYLQMKLKFARLWILTRIQEPTCGNSFHVYSPNNSSFCTVEFYLWKFHPKKNKRTFAWLIWFWLAGISIKLESAMLMLKTTYLFENNKSWVLKKWHLTIWQTVTNIVKSWWSWYLNYRDDMELQFEILFNITRMT